MSDALFDCPVCIERMREPVFVTPCTHRFCKRCYQEYIVSLANSAEEDKTLKCPVCRVMITDCHRDRLLVEMMETFDQLQRDTQSMPLESMSVDPSRPSVREMSREELMDLDARLARQMGRLWEREDREAAEKDAHVGKGEKEERKTRPDRGDLDSESDNDEYESAEEESGDQSKDVERDFEDRLTREDGKQAIDSLQYTPTRHTSVVDRSVPKRVEVDPRKLRALNAKDRKFRKHWFLPESQCRDKVFGRCRYFPHCRKEERCRYVHPTVPCRGNCPYSASTCFYVHLCRRGPACFDENCYLIHGSKSYDTDECGYCIEGSGCGKADCELPHKMCRYGARCRSLLFGALCDYYHPPLTV